MTDVNRRDFIATVGVTAAAGAAAGAHASEPQWRSGAVNHTDLEPHVGDNFVAINPETGERSHLQLVEVTTKEAWGKTSAGEPLPAGIRQPFSLLFNLKSGQPLASINHLVKHESLGAAKLYVSCVCPQQQQFEICFN